MDYSQIPTTKYLAAHKAMAGKSSPLAKQHTAIAVIEGVSLKQANEWSAIHFEQKLIEYKFLADYPNENLEHATLPDNLVYDLQVDNWAAGQWLALEEATYNREWYDSLLDVACLCIKEVDTDTFDPIERLTRKKELGKLSINIIYPIAAFFLQQRLGYALSTLSFID